MRLIRKSLGKTKVNDSGVHSIAYAQVIISQATTGDKVHIYFSSHSLRRKPKHEEFGHHESSELALVLYDPSSELYPSR